MRIAVAAYACRAGTSGEEYSAQMGAPLTPAKRTPRLCDCSPRDGAGTCPL